jgi:hypothetical protein
MHKTFLLENLKRGDHLGDMGSDGTLMSKCILKEWGVRLWIGFVWLGVECTSVNVVMNLWFP